MVFSNSLSLQNSIYGVAMSFSDRMGITESKSVLQTDSIDDDLRNGLWQTCLEFYLKQFHEVYAMDETFKRFMANIFVNFFKLPSDQIPWGHEKGIATVRDWFFSEDWWQVYNFIEFLIGWKNDRFNSRVSFFLEREKAGYRIVNAQLVPITDPVEVRAVSDAASVGDLFIGARQHIHSAISLFSKKPDPDYRNSIKEAVSAVEATARIITGNPKATLGDALKKINERMEIHPALRDAMSKLYGYSSDEGGIRHAMLEEANIDEADAKFMIVTCSAFLNFCVQRSGK